MAYEEPSVPDDSATRDDLAGTVGQVEKTGRRVVSGITDVRDLARLREIVDGAVGQLGRLDVIVANAGICVPKAWDQVTPEIFGDTISTNITGTGTPSWRARRTSLRLGAAQSS